MPSHTIIDSHTNVTHINEPHSIEEVNSITIDLLTIISLNLPHLKQKDVIRFIILLALQPKSLTLDILKIYAGKNNIAQRVLYRHLESLLIRQSV